MSTETQIIEPGFLVALKTGVQGGVDYQRTNIEQDEDGRVKTWETTRYMNDPAEHKGATQVASKAAGAIAKVCVRTPFGLLCRADREAELDAAVAEMRDTVTKWNAGAVHTSVHVTAIKGRIADNDAEAIRAIVDEARVLLDEMNRGLSARDVEQIREAAGKMRSLSQIMTPQSAGWATTALTAAREAATALVKVSNGFSIEVSNSIVEAEHKSFANARGTFLEMATQVVEALPSVDISRSSALEV